MKIRVTMKCPDALSQAADDAGMGVDELQEIASKWFKYDEYVTVEIDTKAETCVVMEN